MMGFFFFILFFLFLFFLVVLFIIIVIVFFFFFFFIHQCDSSQQIQSSSSSSCSSSSSSCSSIISSCLTSPSTTRILQTEYDVFLSFRGLDTRNNFISHLYAALCQNKIRTFIDDRLESGDEISPSLLDAIKKSKIAVVIFSEGYAYSRWCLKELVEILKCKKKNGQIVIPVFYGVSPSDVRNKKGTFGYAFSKLEERFKERVEKLQKWRNALREAANLSGFDSQIIRSDFELIERIVENILKRLNDMLQIDLKEDLVGIESRIEEIKSLLSYESMDVSTFGIWGSVGIGKTTIARAIFNQISSYFDVSCFILNIGEEAETFGGLSHLRWQLLSTLREEENVKSDNLYINHKTVLIVFDGVTHLDQMKCLINSHDRFMSGSLIIITSRNKQVLQNCGVKIIYEQRKLEDVDALKLFSQHAFRQNHPKIGYEELSDKVMQYAQGIPLAIQTLGVYLYGKEKEDWENEINILKKIPNRGIPKLLKVD